MSITPLSTATPYCSVSDFLTLYDFRPFAQLMNDANSQMVTRANLLDPATDEGGRLLTILMAASGEVEASVMLGGKYSPSDLSALTGASAEFLKSLVADLAVGRCYIRRPGTNPWAAQTQTARQLLNAIASGEMLFGTQEGVDAGHLEIEADTRQNLRDRNGVAVGKMHGYFASSGNHGSWRNE